MSLRSVNSMTIKNGDGLPMKRKTETVKADIRTTIDRP